MIAAMLCALVSTTTFASENWYDAYQKFVLNSEYITNANILSSRKYIVDDNDNPHIFYLNDMNKDGVPELIIKYPHWQRVSLEDYVFTFSNDIKYVGLMTGSGMLYSPSGQYEGLFTEWRESDIEGLFNFKYIDDAIIQSDADELISKTDLIQLKGYTAEEIKSMGWDVFVSEYGFFKQPIAFDENILVLLNGESITFDQPPIIIDGRTLVPLRAIFEALGATVEWDGNTQTVTATRDNTVIKITIGDNKLYVNNNVTVLDVPAQIVNDRTLVPVRAVSEAFGCNVDWDGNTKTVSIVSEPYSSAENKQEPIMSEDGILQQILIQNGLNNYLYYMPDDYDGDGHKEAFVFIGSSEPFAKIKVYFINHTGECRVAINETFGYLDEVIQAGTHKFVQWVQSAGGSGSSGILLGCRNGDFYEPGISMKYNFIYKSENGDLFGDENDFSSGSHEYIAIPLWFDDSTGEFYVK